MAYVFAVADNTIVQRDDGASIPWNTELNEPADIDGLAGQMWRAAGSPAPLPYTPPPAPTRWQVPKSVVIARLTDAQLDTVIGAMTNRQKERWRSPDSPSVWNDDAEVIAMLQAIGADPAVVLAMP